MCIVSDQTPVIINSYENIVWDAIEPQRGKKTRIAKEYEPGYMVYTSEEDPLVFLKKAINDEMDSLESNETRYLVELPHNCKPDSCI
jgi:hypothetical protein